MKATKPPINQIICGDAAEVMAGWPDECIDLTVTSPPYDLVKPDDNGNLVTYPRQGLRDYEGYTWDFVSIARQLWRVTKRGGVVVWVVGDQTIDGNETGASFRQALFFQGLGFNQHDTMIYQRLGVGAKGSHLAYWQGFEFMLVFSKGQLNTVNRLRDKPNIYAGTSTGASPKGDELNSRKKNGYVISDYAVRTNVWTYDVSDNVSHPAPFPEALAADHVRSWSNPGDLVADPFSGSGTTAKMAYLLERGYIGIDISPNYCDIARRRVAAATMPIMEAVKPKPEQLALELDGDK